MRKRRGFKLGRRVVKLWRWFMKPTKPTYLRLGHEKESTKTKTITKICNWGRRLSQKLRRRRLPTFGYSHIGQTPFDPKPVPVPKGHLAVYVGRKDDDTHRYLVPVIYFNHPLFGELLREAEREYGFHHSGGITIPCRISEFENVQMKIAGENCHKIGWNRRCVLGDF